MFKDVVASMRTGLDMSAAGSSKSRTTATTEERYDPRQERHGCST